MLRNVTAPGVGALPPITRLVPPSGNLVQIIRPGPAYFGKLVQIERLGPVDIDKLGLEVTEACYTCFKRIPVGKRQNVGKHKLSKMFIVHSCFLFYTMLERDTDDTILNMSRSLSVVTRQLLLLK